MDICLFTRWAALFVYVVAWSVVEGRKFTLSMDTEGTCTNAHYYKAGDFFEASAHNSVHGGHCPLTFIQSGTADDYTDHCVGLCVSLTNYKMDSCQVELAYHDGLNDFNPTIFGCRNFPPIFWCSSKNELKVTISQKKNYVKERKGYQISFDVRPFCGTINSSTTESGVIVQSKPEPSSMSQAAVVIGAIVGTVSILFVICWLIYCYGKRRSQDSTTESFYDRSDRNIRGSTPNQQAQTTNRYAPIQRNQPANQPKIDRGQIRPNFEPNLSNNPDFRTRIQSPFQSSQSSFTQNHGMMGNDQTHQKVLYTDIDRGPQVGEKWYPMTTLGPPNAGLNTSSAFSSPLPAPGKQPSQYIMQNQVYDYPADGEMHTAPVDQRYVVYDIDFQPKPLERLYSIEKPHDSPFRQSPFKDIDKPRMISANQLKETLNKMPLMYSSAFDSTTAESTSDLDSSEEDTTDDQSRLRVHTTGAPVYNFNTPQAVRPNVSNTRLYHPQNFQRLENNSSSDLISSNIPSEVIGTEPRIDGSMAFRPPIMTQSSSGEGPAPQVPPMPKDFQRTQVVPHVPKSDGVSPWPRSPPPPYSED